MAGTRALEEWLGRNAGGQSRMGVQEIIWNCRAWFAGSDRLRPYSACDDEDGERRRGVNRTIAHRDHIHLGLTREGGRMLTSFWTRRAPRRARDTAAGRSTGSRAAAR